MLCWLVHWTWVGLIPLAVWMGIYTWIGREQFAQWEERLAVVVLLVSGPVGWVLWFATWAWGIKDREE